MVPYFRSAIMAVAKKPKKSKKKVAKKSTKKVLRKATPKKRAPKLPEYTTHYTASSECLALWQKSVAELEQLLKDGSRPTLKQLEGYNFRGLNASFIPKLIGTQKFIKSFYSIDYHYGSMLTGHNIVVKQGKPGVAYEKVFKDGRSKVQGVYLVEAENTNYKKYPNTALLHYGRGDNPRWQLAKILREYLAQPYADNPDLLLGKAYCSLDPFEMFGIFFVLERLEKIE